ncbi:MAG: hypothetical protein ACREVD_13345, partial [Burkholderiales bacterium]
AEASMSAADCCCCAPAQAECQAAHCAGASAALLASLDRAPVSRVSDSPETTLARLVAPPARAPDTAPPKPAV